MASTAFAQKKVKPVPLPKVSTVTDKYSNEYSYLKLAENEFAQQRYMYAIPFYRSALTKTKSLSKGADSLASIHLAESYWIIKNYDSALASYRYFENRFGTSLSTRMRIAELLATQKNYADAATIYTDLLQNSPVKYPALFAEKKKGYAIPNTFLQDSLDYRLHVLQLNSQQQDFSPQYYKNGMVFVSNRYSGNTNLKEFGWDGLPFASVYWVKDISDLAITDAILPYVLKVTNPVIRANDDYTSATSNDNNILNVNSIKGAYDNVSLTSLNKFSDELSARYNYGPLCFTQSGDTVYYTRNSNKPNKDLRYNLELAMSVRKNNVWQNSKVLSFVNPNYDYFHPAINAESSVLFFCSNQPGGSGKSDIYYINLHDNLAKPVIFNAGNKINTQGNELFPTISHDTLYFSTDGMAGLGGLDLYKTWQQNGQWQTPVNLGYPVNSSYDDFGIVWNPTTHTQGFMSSNRMGSDDIYAFDYAPFYVNLTGTVLNKKTGLRLDSVKVSLQISGEKKAKTDSFTTTISGNYVFPVKPGRAYTLHFSRNGFTEDSLTVTKTNKISKMEELPTVLLSPEAIPLPILHDLPKDRDGDGIPDAGDKCPDKKGIKANAGCPDIQARINELAKMVFFKTASAELSPVALKPLREVAAIMKEYPMVSLDIEGHTDNRAGADYNKTLSQKRAASVRNFFIQQGLDAARFTANGYGMERPIADNKTEQGRAMNRRVAMKAEFH